MNGDASSALPPRVDAGARSKSVTRSSTAAQWTSGSRGARRHVGWVQEYDLSGKSPVVLLAPLSVMPLGDSVRPHPAGRLTSGARRTTFVTAVQSQLPASRTSLCTTKSRTNPIISVPPAHASDAVVYSSLPMALFNGMIGGDGLCTPVTPAL